MICCGREFRTARSLFSHASHHGRVRPTLADRFWPKVDRSGGPDACWPWTGYRAPEGYGRIFDGKRKPLVASRVAWSLTNGPIPDGLFVCHRCDNPPCCNPAHLFLGTDADNARDMVTKGRHRWSGATACPNGHAYAMSDGHPWADGSRCYLCRRERTRRSNARRRERAAA